MENALYYNAVAVALGGDYAKIRKLKAGFHEWKNVYENMGSYGGLRDAIPDPEKEWKKLQRAHVRFLFSGDETYPPLLSEIPNPPFGLYIKGSLPSKEDLSIAIVGTRRATSEGKEIAKRFARELAQSGFLIISGLAFGIDAAGHEGCLDGGGTTIAVLAGGLHEIYPRENTKLAEKILASGGAIISEYPMGCPPYAARFLERNRIISGLARGTVIIEAPEGSGSLATGRHTMEQNHDLFVVPGSTLHPNFRGSHKLIRQGAELVTDPEEILDSYGIAREKIFAKLDEAASPEEKQVLQALQAVSAPADVDKIIVMTKLEPRIVNQTLSFLLLRGRIKEREGGYTI
jgi:DNA processing protein